MTVARPSSEGQMSGSDQQRRLRWLIFYAWSIPPVFGLGFILLIGVLQSSQVIGILTTPLEPAYILVWLAFSVWFMPLQMRPLADWLEHKPGSSADAAQQAVRSFPLVFWPTFLIYLAVAPASVIIAAEIYTGFVATPYDWLRIELVALIVSIIVGLPIFFLILDLFGQALGAMKLARPIVTIRTRVFLIGALVPLLIGTMLVQYYWMRTGYFSVETLVVWLLLGALAIGSSMIFARSFGQSLSPLQALAGATHPLPETSIAALRARSTDEIGVLTADYRNLLEEQRLQWEILELNNRLLRNTGGDVSTAVVFQQVVELCRQAVNAGQAFVLVFDQEANELVGVIQSGYDYRPEGYYRLGLDEPSLAVWAFIQGHTVAVEDAQQDPRVSAHMIGQFNIRSALAAPLRLGEKAIGVLIAVTHDGPRAYAARDFSLIEGLAREAASALNALQLREARTRAEAARLEHQERFGLLLNSASEGIYGVDTQGICTFVNLACLRMLGYAREEDMIGKAVHALIHHTYPDGRPYPKEECCVRLSTLEGREAHADNEVHWRADGTSFPVEFWSHPIYRNGCLEGAVVTFFDITERKKAEEKINELAFFDQLTGLPNRTLLLDRLKQAMTASTRSGNYGALLMIDLDNFKTINDTLGHDTGDQLLKQVAHRLMLCVREGDTVARLGGDEFVAVLAELSTVEGDAATSIEIVAEKIRATLSQPYHLGNMPHQSTASIGITLFRGDVMNIDELLKQADLAMYESKKTGRNSIRFFDPAMQTTVIERAALEHELRRAIRENQFLLHYQAQVVGEGRVTGAEALLRWQHPERGMVSPAEFIYLIEETGLILPLGHWVLQAACTQLAEWGARPDMAHFTLAVNVSAKQLHQADFADQVLALLGRTGANPQRLKLELTESLLVSDVENAIIKMTALKARGVGFSLDDFGKGYSSLSYLKRLPLDQLKIDQDFVRDILTDPNDAAIAKMIVALAESMGLSVIAEGVEIEAQRDFLARQGCHAYQGYLFSRALPLQEFEALVQRV